MAVKWEIDTKICILIELHLFIWYLNILTLMSFCKIAASVFLIWIEMPVYDLSSMFIFTAENPLQTYFES